MSTKTEMRRLLRAIAKSLLAVAGLSIRRNPPWAIKRGSRTIWPSAWGEYNRDDYVQLFGEDAVVEKRFYNIGAGNFHHPAWTNVDKRSEWYKDNNDRIEIDIDLLDKTPLDVKNDNAQLIYSSHVIEHIPNDCVANLLSEARRALKPGGVLRITCPDADVNYAAYARGDRIFFHYLYNTIQECFLHTFAAQLLKNDYDGSITPEEVDRLFETLELDDALDAITSRCSVEYQRTRPGNHMNWWHLDKLERFLKAAGFSECHRSGYGRSINPVLRDTRFFDNTVPKFSLYMDAVK